MCMLYSERKMFSFIIDGWFIDGREKRLVIELEKRFCLVLEKIASRPTAWEVVSATFGFLSS